MNCKPGDVAIVVKPGMSDLNLGRLVIVLRASPRVGYWRVEGTSPMHRVDGDLNFTAIIEDRRLRPIRDPGDDATDETLDWLSVRTKEHG